MRFNVVMWRRSARTTELRFCMAVRPFFGVGSGQNRESIRGMEVRPNIRCSAHENLRRGNLCPFFILPGGDMPFL
jgi:hypothetical protein